MKNLKRAAGLVAALSAVLAVQGCKGGSDSAVVNPPAPPPAMARPVSITFTDAATGQPITSPITVSVKDAQGNPSTVTQTRAGATASTFTSSGGIALFQISASASLPQTIVAVASIGGYAANSTRITVAANGGVEALQPLVKLTDPPVGVGVIAAPAGSATGGTTTSTVTVATPPEATSGGVAAVTIPAATTITTASGAPLQGALTATVSYFSPSEATSLANFPGGQNNAAQAPGGSTPGSFLTAGFTSIEIRDAAGQTAASFTQPITVTISIPPGTKNPLTGLDLVAGDVVPFWSYNSTNGTWTSQGNLTLQAILGGLEGVGQVTHLSYFAMAWFVEASSCTQPATITISGNPNALPLDITVSATGYTETKTGVTDSTITLTGFVPGVPATITASYLGNPVGSVNVTDLCGASATLTVTLPIVLKGSLAVTVVKQCTEDVTKQTAIPTLPVNVFSSTGGAIGTLIETQFTNSTGTATFASLPRLTPLIVTTGGDVPYAERSITLTADANTLSITYPVTCTQTGASGGG